MPHCVLTNSQKMKFPYLAQNHQIHLKFEHKSDIIRRNNLKQEMCHKCWEKFWLLSTTFPWERSQTDRNIRMDKSSSKAAKNAQGRKVRETIKVMKSKDFDQFWQNAKFAIKMAIIWKKNQKFKNLILKVVDTIERYLWAKFQPSSMFFVKALAFFVILRKSRFCEKWQNLT